jgi:hypothetical protein
MLNPEDNIKDVSFKLIDFMSRTLSYRNFINKRNRFPVLINLRKRIIEHITHLPSILLRAKKISH